MKAKLPVNSFANIFILLLLKSLLLLYKTLKNQHYKKKQKKKQNKTHRRNKITNGGRDSSLLLLLLRWLKNYFQLFAARYSIHRWFVRLLLHQRHQHRLLWDRCAATRIAAANSREPLSLPLSLFSWWTFSLVVGNYFTFGFIRSLHTLPICIKCVCLCMCVMLHSVWCFKFVCSSPAQICNLTQ